MTATATRDEIDPFDPYAINGAKFVRFQYFHGVPVPVADAYDGVLRTLRRLPDDVVLDIAGRDIKPSQTESCLCGWAVRSAFLRAVGRDLDPANSEADDRVFNNVPRWLRRRFGGSQREWGNIFHGVTMHPARAVIEAALIARIFEIVP